METSEINVFEDDKEGNLHEYKRNRENANKSRIFPIITQNSES